MAQKKLALMDFEIGGPEHVEALPWTVQQGDGWFNNSVHIAKALVSHQVQKLGRTEGRADWGQELGPMSVNAFYNVHANTLFVPAALLQQVSRVSRRPPSSLCPLLSSPFTVAVLSAIALLCCCPRAQAHLPAAFPPALLP